MRFQAICPKCGEVVTGDSGAVAKNIHCPACRTGIVIPASAGGPDKADAQPRATPRKALKAAPDDRGLPPADAVPSRRPLLATFLLWGAAVACVGMVAFIVALWRIDRTRQEQERAIAAADSASGWYVLGAYLDPEGDPDAATELPREGRIVGPKGGILLSEAPVKLAVEGGRFTVTSRSGTELFGGVVVTGRDNAPGQAGYRWLLRADGEGLVRLFLPVKAQTEILPVFIGETEPGSLGADILQREGEGVHPRLGLLLLRRSSEPLGAMH